MSFIVALQVSKCYILLLSDSGHAGEGPVKLKSYVPCLYLIPSYSIS
jgi:hypothetical protein